MPDHQLRLEEADVRRIIADLFLRGDRTFPIKADSDLLESGVCDSLGLVQLGLELERAVPGLTIQSQDINRDSLGSVEAILRFVREQGL